MIQKKQESSAAILCAAVDLFARNGFTQTSMRQIAAESEVSLGLINHYYGSKSNLGALTLEVIVRMLSESVDELLDMSQDPVLYDATLTRAANMYLLGGRYRTFYLDCLTEDVFFGFLKRRSVNTLMRITEREGKQPLSEDELDLYGKYLPYSIEKTLVLNKEQGMFQTIGYDKVPEFIIRSELERFVDAFTINIALEHSKKFAAMVLERAPETVPQSSILALSE